MDTLKPINEIASYAGIPVENLHHYGPYIAKVPYNLYNAKKAAASKLILVTSTTPNKAGAGKTTTSIALAQGLKQIQRNAILALREPSLGPVFGMKGGATGGGASSVYPIDDINLHFTGDLHAISSANNLIAALVDNLVFHHRNGKNLRRIFWKRAIDMNDRALRSMITGLGGNGGARETGFDITAASEIMAILSLAENYTDLAQRIDQIIIGENENGENVSFKELDATAAVLALLKNAIHPNLVQTGEGVPAFIHCGPFANIAHGCNSLAATRLAMTFGDYAITEAGFGSDLGAEKFFNIKARIGKLQPAATVLVTNSMSLKIHGGADDKNLKLPDPNSLEAGLGNLKRHIDILQSFGQKVVIAYNLFPFDTDEEISLVRNWVLDQRVQFSISKGFSEGGRGASDLAEKIVEICEKSPSAPVNFSYELDDSPEQKLKKIVEKIYKGASISFSATARKTLKHMEPGDRKLPVCIAKTQYSFTDDPGISGLPTGFNIHFENILVNRGAGFIVAIAGNILRMPGLPSKPAAQNVRFTNGKVEGI